MTLSSYLVFLFLSESKNVSGLVSLLNGCQVVRMVELLRTFGIFGLYQRAGGLVVCLNYKI